MIRRLRHVAERAGCVQLKKSVRSTAVAVVRSTAEHVLRRKGEVPRAREHPGRDRDLLAAS